MNRPQRTLALLALTSAGLPLSFAAQPLRAQQRPVVTPGDYGQWESFAEEVRLSPDGHWLAAPIARVNENDELRIRDLEGDDLLVVAFGSDAVFSPDSRWLAYSVDVSPAERERLERDEEPVRRRVGILELGTSDTISIADVASFRFSGDGRFLALYGYAAEGDSTDTAGLVVRQLATGRTTHFGDVAEFRWADHGALLAVAVRTESGAGNGVQLYDADSGTLRVFDSSRSVYRALSWREDAPDLAVLRTVADSLYHDTTHVVLAWRDVNSESARRIALDPATAPGFPDGMRIAEHRTPEWSEDGLSIYIGLRPADEPVADVALKASGPASGSAVEEADSAAAASYDVKLSDVQIWHARDERIFPRQAVQAKRDLRRTLLAVWHLDDSRVVQIGTDLMDEARVLEGDRFAIETDHDPYRREGMFGRPRDDVYMVDTQTGVRQRVIERGRYFRGGSATGRYLLWFDGQDYWTHDTRSGAKVNITAGVDAYFEDLTEDHPVEILPPHGVAGWLRDDGAVLVYDKYDIWRITPDGSDATRLTRGAQDSLIYRYVQFDTEADGIDPERPIYLSLEGEWTKQSGFARFDPDGEVSQLVIEDARLTQLTRADSADVFAYLRENFNDSPDVFVGKPKLDEAQRVTHTNAFQSDFAWGHSELIEYRSETGRRLQGALFYPAGYDPSRRYPMIVYQYEILSPSVHDYVVPSERSYYNVTVWTSEGYFVLMPDIVYRPRDPGRSAVQAVVPAVQSVIDRGLVDVARVGLIGHSWGGYQATYIPTQTNIFAAAVAGAPLTNFLSVPGAMHWSGGFPELSHWETGQARMEVPPWEDFEAHVRNSPIAFVQDLETPMLMMFGDEDGTVDWHQGIEFYNYARRAGKENFVLLVYPDEDHGLREEENQVDYHRRILRWFGHWLKGEPAPAWITEGVSYLERERRLDAPEEPW